MGKFHREQLKLSKELITKYSTKIIIGITILFYVGLAAFNIKAYMLTQNTIPVVALKGPCVRNQMITEENIQKYKMTEKEFYRYGLENSRGNITNRLIRWDQRKALLNPSKPMFFAYSKKNGDLLMRDDCISTYLDNSRRFKHIYPGKNIIELTITGSNLNTFKKTFRVGDRINIKCMYKRTLSTAVVRSSIKKKSTAETYFDFDLLQIDGLFTNIAIADILNGSGESILDYQDYIGTLPTNEQIEIMESDEYKKNIRASTLMLAVTPAEEDLYNIYRKKDGAMFLISLPPAE